MRHVIRQNVYHLLATGVCLGVRTRNLTSFLAGLLYSALVLWLTSITISIIHFYVKGAGMARGANRPCGQRESD